MGLLKRSRFDKLNHRRILHTAQSLNWEGWLQQNAAASDQTARLVCMAERRPIYSS
jgi:hypothetical protein